MRTVIFERGGQRVLKKSRRGATIIEFAILLPVLLALALGIMEFGLLVRNNLTIANAAREGIRYAALGNTSANVRTRIKGAAATLNPSLTDSQIFLEYTSDRTSSNPTYYSWPADTTGTPPRNGVAAGNLIRVRILYPHQQLTNFFPFMRNRTIAVTVSMAREATG